MADVHLEGAGLCATDLAALRGLRDQAAFQFRATTREGLPLPVAMRDVRVHLHPEDAAVVKQHLAPTENERAWTIIEDPVMARGGCQIATATSRIDARLEARLGGILSELLGTERHAAVPRGGST